MAEIHVKISINSQPCSEIIVSFASLISCGTTGLNTWPAGVHLCRWLNNLPTSWANQNTVLELGTHYLQSYIQINNNCCHVAIQDEICCLQHENLDFFIGAGTGITAIFAMKKFPEMKKYTLTDSNPRKVK